MVNTPPNNTPIKVTNAKPKEAPRKTAHGALDCETREKTASCVLSPNSAKKIVHKEKKKTFQSTLSPSSKIIGLFGYHFQSQGMVFISVHNIF